MRDWDNNGEMDYWDDVFYLENLEREFYAEDYSGGSSYNSSRSSASRSISAGSSVSNAMYAKNSWEEKYGKPSQSKVHINGSFILRMIILLVVGSIIEAFCPPLAFALLVIWAIAEFSHK